MADDYDDGIDAEGELDEDGDGPAAAATPGGPPVRRRRPVVGLTPAQRRSVIRRSNAAAGTQQRRTLATMAFLLRGHLPPSPPLRQRRNIPPLPLPTPPAAAAVPPELSLPDLPPHSRPRTYVMRPPSPGNMDLALPPLRPMSDAPPPPASGVLPTLQAPPRAPALPELRAPLALPSQYPTQQTPPQHQGPPTASSAPPNAAPPMRPAMSPPTNNNPPTHFPHMQPGIPAPPPFMTGGAPLAQWPPMTMALMPPNGPPPDDAGGVPDDAARSRHARHAAAARRPARHRELDRAGRHRARRPAPPAARAAARRRGVGAGPGALTGGSAESRSHSHGHGHGRPAAPPALDGLEYFEPEDIGERGVPRLNRPRHTRFVRAALTARFPHAFVGLDASRPWLMYWGLTASSVLGVDVTEHRGR